MNRVETLDEQLQTQLLDLGALALEMHQRGELDPEYLMEVAAEAAETERELERIQAQQSPPSGQRD
jgi:hypothetical protein